MKEFSSCGTLTPEVTESIMTEEKPNQVEKISIRQGKLSRFFMKDVSNAEVEAPIIKGG